MMSRRVRRVTVKRRRVLWLALGAMLCAWLADGSRPVDAAVTFTVTGLRGGSLADLGSLGPHRQTTHEELTITANPGAALQYRITQTLTRQLINERGARLDPQWIILELTGNTSGTLRIQGPARLSSMPTDLFVSSVTGKAERLTLLASVSLPSAPSGTIRDAPQAGTYTGSLSYVMHSITGSVVRTQTMQVRLRVEPIITLTLAEGFPSRISFGTLVPDRLSEPRTIRVQLVSNLPGTVQLEHVLDDPMRNQRGDEFPVSAIELSSTFTGGERTSRPMTQRMTLSPSVGNVSTPSQLELVYRTVVPEHQAAGMYRGTIALSLSGTTSLNRDRLRIPMELTVPQILSLTIQSPDGGQPELNFGSPVLGRPSELKALVILVKTNSGRPYQLMHSLSRPFVGKKGQALPSDALQCAPALRLDGSLQAPLSPVPVSSRGLIYRSDLHGTPLDKLFMVCQVTVPQDTLADTYRTRYQLTLTPP